MVTSSTSISEATVTAWQSVAQIGLYFTIPAGWTIDHLGPATASIAGVLMTAAGFLGMAFTGDSWHLLMFGGLVAGFGGGTMFMVVLTMAIQSNPESVGTAISFVGSSMSLSIAFTTAVRKVYAEAAGCGSDCSWVPEMRVMGVVSVAFMLPAVIYAVYSRSHPMDPPEEDLGIQGEQVVEYDSIGNDIEVSLIADDELDGGQGGDGGTGPASFLASLAVFKHPFFYGLMAAYFTGIATGIYVVTNFKLWAYLAPGTSYNSTMGTLFSVCNCLGTLGAGAISDWAEKYRVRRATILVGFLIWDAAMLAGLGIVIATHPHHAGAQVAVALCVGVGFSFGACFALFPAIVTDVYGPSNFGKVFGFLQIGSTSALIVPSITTSIQTKFNFYIIPFVLAALCIASVPLLLLFSPAFAYAKATVPDLTPIDDDADDAKRASLST